MSSCPGVLVFLIGLLVVLTPTTAYAYMDPGTGSMLLQGLIGGIAAGLLIIKLYWRRLRAVFSPKETTAPVKESNPTPP